MAVTLISQADGNFTDGSSVWLQNFDNNLPTAPITTGYVTTTAYPTFNGSSSTAASVGTQFDSVMVWLSRLPSVSGTFSLTLHAGTTAEQDITISCSTIPITGGWMTFKYSTPWTVTATNTSVVYKAKSSIAGEVTVGGSSTSSSSTYWAMNLASTTNTSAGPQASANLLILNNNITMNNITTTSFGEIDVYYPYGKLAYGTSASTNYYLKLAGDLNVYGTVNIGTSASPMPSTSTAVLEFASASAGGFGLNMGSNGNLTTYGVSMSAVSAKLVADVSAGATSLTTDTSTGWTSGSSIAIAGTGVGSVGAGQSELKVMSGDAVGTTVNISTTLSNSHKGTSPFQGRIINLSRNVKIRGINQTTGSSEITLGTNSNASFNWTEFSMLGASSTVGGITIPTVNGNVVFNGCSLHDFNTSTAAGFNFSQSSTILQPITISNTTVYNLSGPTIKDSLSGTAIHNMSLSNLSIIKDSGTAISLTHEFDNISINGLYIANSTATGLNFSSSSNGYGYALPTAKSVEIHSCTTSCVNFDNGSGSFTDVKFWNSTNGMVLNSTVSSGWYASQVSYISGGLVANNSALNVNINNSCKFKADAIAFNGSASGLNITNQSVQAVLSNCTFGATTTALSGDIVVSGNNDIKIVAHNCSFNSPTMINGLTVTAGGMMMTQNSYIASLNHNNVTGSHKTWLFAGSTRSTDSTFFVTSSPAERITPNYSLIKVPSSSQFVPVNASNGATVSVKVRVDSTYTGAAPRLMCKACPFAGIINDTLLATHPGTTGSFVTLSGTLPTVNASTALEVYVDCDGTAGFITVDNWSD